MSKQYKRCARLAWLAAVLLCTSPAALAGTDSFLQLLEVLERNGAIDARTAEQLRRSVAEEDEARKEKEAHRVTASMKGGKLKFKSGDGDFKFGIHGRAQTDYAYYSDGTDRDLGSGAEIRRARIALKGALWKHWHFTGQYDFTGSAHLRTVDLKYTGLKDWQFQVGHFKQPFSMEHQSSSKTITFMERSLGNAFHPDRDAGFAVQHVGEMWRARAGVYFPVDEAGDNETEGGDWDIGARFNFTPLHDKLRVLHLGFGFLHRNLESGGMLRVRARPESHVTGVRLVDTGRFAAQSRSLYGFEAAWKQGPLSIMGEYNIASVERDAGADPDFSSYYGQISYILTGETRSYKRKAGAWGGVKPASIVGKGGRGAWEVAARLSRIDLTDGAIDGGAQSNLTLGLNWYLTPTIRLNANYISVLDLEQKDGVGDVDDAPDIFQLRAQYEF